MRLRHLAIAATVALLGLFAFMSPTLSTASTSDIPAQEVPSDVVPAESTAVVEWALQSNLDIIWMIVAACMVFLMQAGFTLVETGLTRSKNAVNIIMKNVMDVSAGCLVFFAIGFALMFGPSAAGFVGTDGFFLSGLGEDPWNWAFFVFQAVFAATAATIVSGAVAERTRFTGYLIFSILITGFIYPVFGSWAWGGLSQGSGWLEQLGFIDFAGSTVVHSIGGWAALAGAIIVGPRLGKYNEDGKPIHIAGHSLPLAALGVFILWFGWFGFNAGSTLTGDSSVALIIINTMLASAAGATMSMGVTWARSGKPDAPTTLNGVLIGLVSITAGCANLQPGFAILTGAIAGVILVYSSALIERWVDDAVGAVAVHGVGGAWGTLAAGMFDSGDPFNLSVMGVQLIGIVAAFTWAFPLSLLVFWGIKRTVGLRVENPFQVMGLDRHEHANRAYPEFMAQDTLEGAEV